MGTLARPEQQPEPETGPEPRILEDQPPAQCTKPTSDARWRQSRQQRDARATVKKGYANDRATRRRDAKLTWSQLVAMKQAQIAARSPQGGS